MSEKLWQAITSESNFFTAWQKNRSNFGAPGIDRVSIDEFESNLHDNLALLRQVLLDGSYQPLPLVSFNKEKKDNKTRTLYISSLRDKVVQQALLQVLQPVLEKIFLSCSYAYRPGKSQQKAIERVERNIKRGRTWVFDADIANFFDEIDRGLLLEFLAEYIPEKQIIAVIERTIQLVDNPQNKGVAQGLVLAPILSNVYLHKMDDRMMRAQWNYLRYSDNILVLDLDEDGVKKACARAEACIQEVRLQFNTEKTHICQLQDGFSFLGFYFDERGKRPDAPAVKRLDQKIDQLLHRAAEYSDTELKQKLEAIVRGWLNYFQLSATDKQKLLGELDQKFAEQTDSLPLKITKAALAYQLGDRSRARAEITSGATLSTEDAEMNYQWGILCEVLELPGEAYDSYLNAFRLNSEHPEAAYRLGLHYLQQQQYESAIRYLKKAVQLNPQNAAMQFALGTAHQRLGLNGPAQLALNKAAQIDPRIRKLISAPSVRVAEKSKIVALPYTENDVAAFLKAFSGREGVFARQWLSPHGKLGYQPVYQHLSTDEIKAHLDGKVTLGYYMMRTDNTVNQMVIDLDITKQVRLEIPEFRNELENWGNLLQTDALKIAQLMRELGIVSYLEDSGFKGHHLWVFFIEPQPAREVILFAKKLLDAAGAPAPGIHREVFPDRSHVSAQALGPMVKLPLGVHKLTNRRCLWLETNGLPFTDQLAVLQNIEFIATEKFKNALQQLQAPAQAAVTAVKPEEQEQIETLLKKCNVLRYLKEQAESEKMLAHIDRLTILGILGHWRPAGPLIIHQIMSQTLNYNYRITEKWIQRQKGLPVSCPKIREWQNHITPSLGCYCKFPELKNSYPTPLLHLDPEFIIQLKKRQKSVLPPTKETALPELTGAKKQATAATELPDTAKPVSVKEMPAPETPLPVSGEIQATGDQEVNALFAQYLHLKKAQRETSVQISEIEDRLTQLCKRYHCDHFITNAGCFRRVQLEGQFRWVLEV